MTKSRNIFDMHGRHGTPTYNVWASMKARCECPTNAAYANYGGRGITIDPSWAKFSGFYTDMGDAPNGLTLERLDNDKGYSKQNCRWVDRKTQGRNKRNNVLLTIDGETLTLVEWAERYGIRYATVHQRVTKYGWTPEAAVKTPLVTQRKGIPRGQKLHGTNHGVRFHDEQESAA